MNPRTTARVSLTAMLGTPVTDAQGHLRGRLKDVAVATGPDAGKVAGLVLKTRQGLQIVPSNQVMETPSGTLELRSRLMPCTYTLAWQARTLGLPTMRPLVLNYPNDPNVWDLGTE